MAKDGKFGTFAGVYIPSLLTILGVIMYLRLPWILGNGGLYVTLGIIGAAHIVSICTGLSVSSIATDKKVGAGGPYYIISRSLGLPIGGAIGLALFVGMGFAIALHIVGFSESVLSALGVEATPNAIRIAGTITLVGITTVAFISTSLAITTQYPILVMVAASVVVVFIGSTDSPAQPQMSAHASSPSFALMFGIFFPAATGFMSGVNMSGDLRDPQKSIIRGTILAIVSALALYVALTVFLAFKIEPERLRNDTHILEHMALWGPVVIAGIWGATLSSAFGAVLGAPRILQAIAADRIAPHGLSKGHGPANEPRRATLVAFLFAEAGILIAELNLIARIVSMIYLTQYAFINIACAVESWASPDFRPKFRIPKLVSIIGALACVLLMIQLDLLAMMGATALMIGLFVYLQRRQLTLESGDAWEGVWATIVRAGLHRMHKSVGQQRNWRPNVLLFDDAGHERHGAIRAFATTLASGNGMVTDFGLAPPNEGDEVEADAVDDKQSDKVGVFDARIVTKDPLETIASVCQFHGLTGLAPNTLLLPWRKHAVDPDSFLRVLNAAAGRDLNILLFEEPRDARRLNRQIDVWWSREAGNLALSVALARFITRAPEWERAAITVYIVGEGTDDDEVLRAKAMRYLATTRVDGRVLLVQRPRDERLADLVCNESRTADLVLLGLPADLAAADRDSLANLDRVAVLPGGVVFLRAGGVFADALAAMPVKRRVPRAPGAPTPPAGIPALTLPDHPELAATVTALVAHESTQLTRVQDRLASGYGLYLDLCAVARKLVEQRAETMIAAAAEDHAAKRRKQLAVATNTFLVEADRVLAQITADGVAAQATLLAEVLAEVTKQGAAMPPAMPPVVHIERGRMLFGPAADDTIALRAWKRRRRWRYFYRRTIPQSIPILPLVQSDHDRILGEDVTRIVGRFRSATHELAVDLGRTLATAEWKAHAELSRATLEDTDRLVERIVQTRDETLARLDALAAQTRERIAEDAQSLDAAALESARKLAATLDRVDAPLAARAAQRQRHKRDAVERLPQLTESWRDQQLQLLARARLAVRLARFRDRLTIASAGIVEEVIATAHASARRAIVELRDTLIERREAGVGDGPPVELRDEVPYDASPLVARFAQVVAMLSSELPETETLLVDDAAAALVRGDSGSETTTLPVRASVQSIVEADLITRLGAEIATVAEADARGWAVLRETMLLVSARPREQDDEDPAAQGDALTDAIARLDSQLAKLREVETAFVQAILGGLQAIAGATAIDALSSSLLERSGRRVTTQRPSRVLELARRGVTALRDTAANVIYRRSAGVVFAHEARTTRAKGAAQTLRELTAHATIRANVAAKLPLYYRNLFTGQVNINESFFVGRDASVRAGVDVVGVDSHAALRCVLVTGNRGSGKTTLCQQIASATQGETYWVTAPPGGDATVAGLRAAFEASLGKRGTPSHLLKRLPEGSVIVIDDLDLWWERRPGGLDAIDSIIDVVGEHADHVGFVLGGSGSALRVIRDLRPLSRVVQRELDCQPLPARALEKVIMARHSSTGLGLKLAGRDSFGTWTRARLFDAHFDYAKGNVGYALRSWVTHIDELDVERLIVRVPVELDWDAIDDLPSEHVALLIELVLHKAATAEKLERVTGRSADAIADGLAELTAIGLVVQNRRKVAQVNPFVHVPVVDWLDRKELA